MGGIESRTLGGESASKLISSLSRSLNGFGVSALKNADERTNLVGRHVRIESHIELLKFETGRSQLVLQFEKSGVLRGQFRLELFVSLFGSRVNSVLLRHTRSGSLITKRLDVRLIEQFRLCFRRLLNCLQGRCNSVGSVGGCGGVGHND